MDYVKSLKMFGVDAQQIPCITGEGVPTTETEGAVGCLYMNITNGDIYKCVSVREGIYEWKKTADKGADGVSPTVTVTDIDGGHRITITDASGAKSVDIMDGANCGYVGSSTGCEANYTDSGARGHKCKAGIGMGTYASGFMAESNGTGAHSLGYGTITYRTGQLAVGEWNEKNTKALVVVGCGTSDTDRRNALTVYEDAIKIGDTKITEAQLKALAALIPG